MEYLRAKPTITMAAHRVAATRHSFFFAEVFSPRPEFGVMLQFTDWASNLQVALTENLARPACPLAWFGLFIDHEGACLIGTPKKDVTVGNFRQACYKVLEGLPGEQQEMAMATMRPLDEVDFLRISQWECIEAFRPTRARGPATKLLAIEDGSPPRTWKTKAEFFAENEEVPCMDLAIPMPGVGHGWISANSECTFVVAATGALPPLEYERCRLEPRRELLLVRRMERGRTLVSVVQLAIKLCGEGAFPPYQKKYKADFVSRCANALALKMMQDTYGPIECPSESSADDQRRISNALDGHASFDGCFGCMTEDPEWKHGCASMQARYGPAANFIQMTSGKHSWSDSWIFRWVAESLQCGKCNTPRSRGRAQRQPAWDYGDLEQYQHRPQTRGHISDWTTDDGDEPSPKRRCP